MKRLFSAITALIASALLTEVSTNAQTAADGLLPALSQEWRQAFSQEGRKAWKPEFTLREYAGFVTSGPALTGGVRIDGKRTLGLTVAMGDTYLDAAPGNIYSISAGLYKRRYFHLGGKDIIAFYSDLAIGAGYVYKVEGRRYDENPETGERWTVIDEKPGDILFAASWQPGVRIRFWRNFHLFLGPTLATNTIGLHLGVGL